MIGTREPFDYVVCRDCGCLQIAEIPDASELERYYAADYYTATQDPRSLRSGASGWGQLRRAVTLGRLVLARRSGLRFGRRPGRLHWLARTGTGFHDAILDVGCGSGRLLHRLARAGFTDLTGIDARLPAEACRVAGRPRLLRTSLEMHEGHYRLVMAHHSFEHMRDPRAAFDAMARLVEPGGWLLLRIPRADGGASRPYAADWVQLDAPRHLHLHTHRSIERLAERAGLRLEHVEDDSGPFQIWGSELYRRDIALSEAGRGGRGVFSRRERLAYRRRATALRRAGQGDQACFFLRRDGCGARTEADAAGSIRSARSLPGRDPGESCPT
jgi:SAM-dependent methyltransferase